MITKESQSEINSDHSLRLSRLEVALRKLHALHVCDSVKAPFDSCPICEMWAVLEP